LSKRNEPKKKTPTKPTVNFLFTQSLPFHYRKITVRTFVGSPAHNMVLLVKNDHFFVYTLVVAGDAAMINPITQKTQIKIL